MEKTLKDVLSDRIDTKVGAIAGLDVAIKAFQNDNAKEKKPVSLDGNNVIIITNFASIACELIYPDADTKELSTAQLIFKTAFDSSEKIYETFSSDTTIVNNSKTLLLKNAQIVPFACPQHILNYEVLALFTDQIVGVTFGSFNRNSN